MSVAPGVAVPSLQLSARSGVYVAEPRTTAVGLTGVSTSTSYPTGDQVGDVVRAAAAPVPAVDRYDTSACALRCGAVHVPPTRGESRVSDRPSYDCRTATPYVSAHGADKDH